MRYRLVHQDAPDVSLAGALFHGLAVEDFEAGEQEQIHNLESFVGVKYSNNTACRRTGYEVPVVNIEEAAISHMNSIGPERIGLLQGLKLFDIHASST
jgi:hypothetical protein